jgi:uncharacterized protein (DUF1330 family)
MALILGALAILVGAVVLAAVVQELRYLRARRGPVADKQTLTYPSTAFHVVTVMAMSPDRELASGVREFVAATERFGGKVVYAGKIAVNALESSQLPPANWDAFVLAQYPSREAYAITAANPDFQKVRSSFSNSYALGMERFKWLNLALPIGLLGIRTVDILKRTPARYPFKPAGDIDQIPAAAQERRARVVGGLLANREYGKDAVVVLNFIKNGSKEEREANSGYGAEMFALMAEMGNGPMHIGRAVTLEGDAEFDNVIVVYYPGVEYFAELLQSEFFTGIVVGKQLGDTLSSPTVPLLPHL